MNVKETTERVETDDEPEDTTDEGCPACGGPVTLLGTLGKRKHFRCRNCGLDSSETET